MIRLYAASIVALSLSLSIGSAVWAASALTIGVSPDIYYAGDEILYLEGQAPSNQNVEVHFTKESGKPVKFIARSDANGEWVFAEKVPLEEGNWEVRIRTVESSGGVSAFSNPRIIKVIVPGIVIGGAFIKFSFLIFLLFALLVASAALIGYFAHRAKQITRESEQDSARIVVEENFNDLRRKIRDELEHLDERTARGTSSKTEEDHRNHLLRELREAEEAIEKKMKNIS